MPDPELSTVLFALADPTRRSILTRLRDGDATVSELLEPLSISQPALSKHLKVLASAGLVTTSADAQRRPRKLEAAPLELVAEWLEDFRPFWEDSARRKVELQTLLTADESIEWE